MLGSNPSVEHKTNNVWLVFIVISKGQITSDWSKTGPTDFLYPFSSRRTPSPCLVRFLGPGQKAHELSQKRMS